MIDFSTSPDAVTAHGGAETPTVPPRHKGTKNSPGLGLGSTLQLEVCVSYSPEVTLQKLNEDPPDWLLPVHTTGARTGIILEVENEAPRNCTRNSFPDPDHYVSFVECPRPPNGGKRAEPTIRINALRRLGRVEGRGSRRVRDVGVGLERPATEKNAQGNGRHRRRRRGKKDNDEEAEWTVDVAWKLKLSCGLNVISDAYFF
ncbi:hypothetical protein H4582DRAFT_2059289 [Lactarius indigo]|nr:hypothetical protein H4582DRAFT_2059289 [Lactarius indigo]